MKILIAEDDFTSRNVLSGVLKKLGHEMVEVCTGTAAWEAMRQPDAPRLAVIDWMMPGMDGPEVIRRIRSLATDQPPYLIMLTSKSEKADIIVGLEAGASDYLAKPFDSGELRARVEVGRRLIEMQAALAGKIEELRRAFDQIKTLRGIVPICAGCKKIRDDKGYWDMVEVYVSNHTEAQFSHCICPDCMKRLYPEFMDKEPNGSGDAGA